MSQRVSRVGFGLVGLGVVAAVVAGCSSNTSGSAGAAANSSVSNGATSSTSAASHPAAPTTSATPAAPKASAAKATAPKTPATKAAAPKKSAPKAPAASKPITVNKSISDPVLGHKATVMAYVPSFTVSPQTAKKYAAGLDGKHVLLVEFKVTAGDKYYTTLGADDFYALDGSSYPVAESTDLLTKDMKAAGYTPLADADSGKTSTGWVAYFVDAHAKSLTVEYQRLAATTSNGKTIKAENIDVKLPR